MDSPGKRRFNGTAPGKLTNAGAFLYNGNGRGKAEGTTPSPCPLPANGEAFHKKGSELR